MANNQIVAADVKPNILSVVLINAPAPKKPILVTIALSKGRGLIGSKVTAVTAKAQAPTATKAKVPKPIGLCFLCRSRPKSKDRMNARKKRQMRVIRSIDNFKILHYLSLYLLEKNNKKTGPMGLSNYHFCK